jgi:glycosyltransferase involved in cell wall biosynthesis
LAPHFHGAAREEEMDGLHVHRFRYGPDRSETLAYGGGILPNLRADSKRWTLVGPFMSAQFYEMVRVARRYRVDVIHAHWVLPQGLVATAGRRWLHCPVVLSAHGSDVYSMRTGTRHKLLTHAVRRADACTAVSRPLAAELKRLTSVEALVVPMGVNISAFDRQPIGSDVSSGHRVLFVGRLVDQKGIDRLIEAFAQVRVSFPDALLRVVGDGPERAALEALANQLGLGSAVEFIGALPHDRMAGQYRDADVFVLPSIRNDEGDTEGLSVVALEAAASSLPIVASNMGGITDVIVDHKTGLLVEPGNPHAIASAIVSLFGDAELRSSLGMSARASVQERFSWDSIAGQFEAIFRSVI